MTEIKNDLKYSSEHEWVKIEGDDVATVSYTHLTLPTTPYV